MTPDGVFDTHDACNLRSLALSAPQTRMHILNNKLVFSNRMDDHLIELTRLRFSAAGDHKTRAFTNSSQLRKFFEDGESDKTHYDLELYSLSQRNTWAPLGASAEMISSIEAHYGLSSCFLQTLACFRDRILPTEEAFPGTPRLTQTLDRAEIGWVYKYAEKKEVDGGNPWRIRQTGIYHLRDHLRRKSVLFLVHPNPSAHFKNHLFDLLRKPETVSALLACPMLIHPMLISTHLYAWQEYLEYHETALLRLAMRTACTSLKSLEESLITFDTLKNVREVEKALLPLNPLLEALRETIQTLKETEVHFIDVRASAGNHLKTIHAALTELAREAGLFKMQALHLQKRGQATAQSVLDTLNLGFQDLAQSQSKNTHFLATSAREDSVAIRAITLVTSLYLPFSFVATLFGMNLVDFDEETRDLVVSHKLWLYFVISVPLTAATLVCWRYIMRNYQGKQPRTVATAEQDEKSGSV